MGSAGRGEKCGLYSRLLHFHFYILALAILFFDTFLLYTQEQQHAPSPPISPIRGDGDAAANPINGSYIPVSEADQQGHDMGTQVFSYASSIFSSNCGRHRCLRHFI
jgi:hypothetical protein